MIVGFLCGRSSPGSADVQAAPIAVLPFELYVNRIFVPVSVNGSKPLVFIVDSGASTSVLNLRAATALHVPLTDLGMQKIGTGQTGTRLFTARSVSLQAGPGVDVVPATLAVLGLDDVESYDGHVVDGVLGSDLFAKYVVEIDYDARRLRFYDPLSYAYLGSGVRVPLKVNGWPLVVATVRTKDGSASGSFILDTGKRGSAVLNRPFVERNKLAPSTGYAFTGQGVGGEYAESLGRVESIEIGPIAIGKPIVAFSQAANGATARGDIAGAIGAEILRGFTVIFDERHNLAYFERSPKLPGSAAGDTSGMVIVAQGADLRTYVVRHVFGATPAATAGVAEGDILLAVAGRPASSMTLEAIRNALNTGGPPLTLLVSRGSNRVALDVARRALL